MAHWTDKANQKMEDLYVGKLDKKENVEAEINETEEIKVENVYINPHPVFSSVGYNNRYMVVENPETGKFGLVDTQNLSEQDERSRFSEHLKKQVETLKKEREERNKKVLDEKMQKGGYGQTFTQGIDPIPTPKESFEEFRKRMLEEQNRIIPVDEKVPTKDDLQDLKLLRGEANDYVTVNGRGSHRYADIWDAAYRIKQRKPSSYLKDEEYIAFTNALRKVKNREDEYSKEKLNKVAETSKKNGLM